MFTRSKVCLIGYGYWGKKLFSTLKKLGNQVVVVEKSSVNSEIEQSSLERVLSDDQIEYCFIATPEKTHFPLVKQCLEAGKHVFVEKPLALKKTNAKALLEISKKRNLLLIMDTIFKYDPGFLTLLGLLEKYDLGQIKKISSLRHSGEVAEKNIMVFQDLFPHDGYLLHDLFPEMVFSLEEPPKINVSNNEIKGTLYFPHLVFSFDYGWFMPQKRRKMVFKAEKGELVWESNANKETVSLVINNKKIDSKRINHGSKTPLQKMIEDFLTRKKAHSLETKERLEEVALMEYFCDYVEREANA